MHFPRPKRKTKKNKNHTIITASLGFASPIVHRGGPPQPCTSGRSPHLNCVDCGRSFLTKIGLGVHRRPAHLDEANADVRIAQISRRWSPEELRLLAREEALAVSRGVRFVNQHLLEILRGTRTIDSIKGVRRSAAYKALVVAALQDLEAVPEEEVPGPNSPGPAEEVPEAASVSSPRASTSQRWSAAYGTFEHAVGRLGPVIQQIRGFGTTHLLEIVYSLQRGRDVSRACCAWLQGVFPATPERPRRPNRGPIPTNVPKKIRRRWEYARMQRLSKTSMGRAACEILGGPGGTCAPSLATMTAYWEPYVSQPSLPAEEANGGPPPREDLQHVWHPVTCEEVAACNIPLSSAPGVAGITPRQWRAVPESVRALFTNIVLSRGAPCKSNHIRPKKGRFIAAVRLSTNQHRFSGGASITPDPDASLTHVGSCR